MQPPRQRHAREQQLADSLEVLGAVDKGVEVGLGLLDPRRPRAADQLARVERPRQVLGHLAEDARLAPGLALLDLVPVLQDLAAVAEHCRQKLIRRHPHVYGEAEASTAGEVLANWDQIKQGEAGREPGIFGEVPENLPALLYARKLIRRARSGEVADPAPDLHAAVDAATDFDSVGDLLFAVVAHARRLHVDPELALRAAADRFRAAHE
ncbi:MAG TPA: hypothetical protein VGW10_09975 [Solirubrobacteraceae bacterium]|nr:hypothetical protein [Solirubrobacteraceae bacterium]